MFRALFNAFQRLKKRIRGELGEPEGAKGRSPRPPKRRKKRRRSR